MPQLHLLFCQKDGGQVVCVDHRPLISVFGHQLCLYVRVTLQTYIMVVPLLLLCLAVDCVVEEFIEVGQYGVLLVLFALHNVVVNVGGEELALTKLHHLYDATKDEAEF